MVFRLTRASVEKGGNRKTHTGLYVRWYCFPASPQSNIDFRLKQIGKSSPVLNFTFTMVGNEMKKSFGTPRPAFTLIELFGRDWYHRHPRSHAVARREPRT